MASDDSHNSLRLSFCIYKKITAIKNPGRGAGSDGASKDHEFSVRHVESGLRYTREGAHSAIRDTGLKLESSWLQTWEKWLQKGELGQ